MSPVFRDLPRTQVFDYQEADDGEEMEFRLIYEGPLPSGTGSSSRAKEKHLLRKHFHFQLRELWKQHSDLKNMAETGFIVSTTPSNMFSAPGPNVREITPVLSREVYTKAGVPYPLNAKTWVEHIADDHIRCGGRFVPLVSKAGGYTCALDILFLRRDNPGNIVASGGDIDNRIKVLFDGLRMPDTVGELGGISIDADENPFFCLLEDDNLITSVTVTTDRLMTPLTTADRIHDVCLIIHATVVNPSAIFAGNRLV